MNVGNCSKSKSSSPARLKAGYQQQPCLRAASTSHWDLSSQVGASCSAATQQLAQSCNTSLRRRWFTKPERKHLDCDEKQNNVTLRPSEVSTASSRLAGCLVRVSRQNNQQSEPLQESLVPVIKLCNFEKLWSNAIHMAPTLFMTIILFNK